MYVTILHLTWAFHLKKKTGKQIVFEHSSNNNYIYQT